MEEDIINLRRPGTKPRPGPHSEYDVSLAQGKMEGEYSDGPSNSFSSNNPNEELPGEDLFIPPATDLQLPVYFSKRDIRKYNPLYTGSSSPEPVQTQLELAGSWLAGSDNNSKMEPSGEPVPVASILNLADCWLTRSDHDSSSETSGLLEPGLGSSVPVPVNLAKTWLADSDSGPDLSSASEPVPVLNLADSWVAGVPESVHKETGPEHSSILPLNIAEGWLAGYENYSGDDRSSVPDPVFGSEQIPEPVLSYLIAPVPLNLAETWLAGSNHGSGMPEPGHSVLDLADTWGQDLEASGSDDDKPLPLSPVHDSGQDHTYVLEPGPSVLHLTDSWMAGAHLGRDHEEPEPDDDVEPGSEDEGVNEGSGGLRRETGPIVLNTFLASKPTCL